jgi:hypothetical protein
MLIYCIYISKILANGKNREDKNEEYTTIFFLSSILMTINFTLKIV